MVIDTALPFLLLTLLALVSFSVGLYKKKQKGTTLAFLIIMLPLCFIVVAVSNEALKWSGFSITVLWPFSVFACEVVAAFFYLWGSSVRKGADM